MKTVAILRGGIGDEHDVSLKTGATALKYLDEAYTVVDVFIDQSGVWHMRGAPKKIEQVLASVDVVFNALHGQYGEDGEVQRTLDRFSIPYTGSKALPSALAMNKSNTKDLLKKVGIKTPHSITLSVSPDIETDIVSAFRSFPQPSVVKPARSGSSVGVTLARTFDEFALGVKKAFQHSKEVLVEEFIQGREATVGIVESLRGREWYALPVVEIVPKEGSVFFDYDAKYSGESEERCPGNFSQSETKTLQEMAERTHRALGLRHYSRSDFIVSPNGVYFLETNTLPGLTKESLFPKSLAAVGMNLSDFFEHMITLAEQKG